MFVSQLVAQVQPDTLDVLSMVLYFAMVIGLPLLGYWLMVIDIRAYLRSLRRALMVVTNHLPELPAWARQHTPGCLRSLGLEMPCREEDVKRAYRRLAENMHPDRGGDQRRFMILQRQYEEALRFISDSEHEPGEPETSDDSL